MNIAITLPLGIIAGVAFSFTLNLLREKFRKQGIADRGQFISLDSLLGNAKDVFRLCYKCRVVVYSTLENDKCGNCNHPKLKKLFIKRGA